MIRGNKRQTGKHEAESTVFLCQAKGTGIALAVTLALLCVCGALVNGAVIPEKNLDICVLMSCALGVVTGGTVAARGKRRGALLRGLSVGLSVAAILALSGLLLYSSMDVFWGGEIMGACVLGGCAAGLINGGRGGYRRN